ncbi:hypothetical protein K439DRAFT_1612209 [Ramaria rubella]|nr:hypothetical protein K439DRAFT_1612209 [Ramaria rubella]
MAIDVTGTRHHWTPWFTFLLKAGGGGNFPDIIWNKVAQLMTSYHAKGAVKSAKACKVKWSQLKEQFAMVNKIKTTSGFAWDDNLGVNRHCGDDDVWNGFMACNPSAKAYINRFLYYETTSVLMPNKASGKHTYQASNATVGPTNSSALGDSTQTQVPANWISNEDVATVL